ncbi:GNAT family N-acetyltransferase [Novosphingobium sp. TH158]|uniref:GNAT family N-acetyltransferase n=1 Tax=Novosphingobium sp. TH158 TaxID=2067455 RepID=UPI000C7C40A6|nr:GNAT family N-acetyltransferase [Novosphingobium sp. TH158]PLK27925.1 GNAT family N-acetyltransferase [Novosphingobium sp. TH158]
MILRPAGSADAPALARLGRDSFVAKFGDMYRPQDLSTFLEEAYSEAAIAAELANPQRLYHLAERDGALVGYCKLGLVCGFPEHARGKHVLELKQLYTAPGQTGGGIGKALMDWAMAEFAARGADEVQLSVWSGNEGAQRFYARYGFAKVADVTFRVGEQLDEEFLFARLI